MKVRGIRWEPHNVNTENEMPENTYLVETYVTHNGHNYFVVAKKESEKLKLAVTRMPILDVLMGVYFSGVDKNMEMEKIESVIYEYYNFEEKDVTIEIRESEFIEAFRLTRRLLEVVSSGDGKNRDAIEGFINDYRGRELDLVC